jgi:hypothetical protein
MVKTFATGINDTGHQELVPGVIHIGNGPNFVWYLKLTLKGKSHLCIPILGIAWLQSQFPHACVCERFTYYQDRSIYFLAAE